MKWHKIFEQRLVILIFFTLFFSFNFFNSISTTDEYYGNNITDIDKILYTTNTSIDVD